MEYIHTQKNISSSPRKLRLVADMVRKLSPDQALEALQFTNKAAAVPLSKAIKTVLANAQNQANLNFKSIEINEGSKLKRMRPGSKGRAKPYKRRLSHIKIVLSDEVQKTLETVVQKVRRSDKSDKEKGEKLVTKN